MLLEVLCRDTDGQPYYQGGEFIPSASTLTTQVDYVLFGDQIEVRVKADDGTILGDWVARNVYPAAVVTATQFRDGSVAVTDNASNTFYKVVKDA